VTRTGSGTTVEDVVIAFAPGETTTLWTQHLRHRARSEKDVAEMMVIGYAMDHEGYLLTVDDWLLSGYEPSITWWGPLQGEYLLEQLLEVSALATTDTQEDPSYPDFPTESWYPDWQTPLVVPDSTPEAGTLAEPLPEYVFTRDGVLPETAGPPADLARLQGIARWSFFGSDPAMGLPRVAVQREGDDGTWSDLLAESGESISDTFADIIVTYTPNPLSGTGGDPDPTRTHLYHAEWQAVETSPGLATAAGLALGNYRLHASGQSRDPGDMDYPFDGVPWEGTSNVFAIRSAQMDLSAEVSQETVTIVANYSPYQRGYRNVHPVFPPDSALPLASGEVTVTPGEVTTRSDEGAATRLQISTLGLPSGPTEFSVTDEFGNNGLITVDLPE
jgi:neutral ceramidase